MTALGLVVAVPAVLAYNWLQRRNKSIAEDLSAFSNDVLGYLASDGAVRPARLPASQGCRRQAGCCHHGLHDQGGAARHIGPPRFAARPLPEFFGGRF
jgi:hypothetical protein